MKRLLLVAAFVGVFAPNALAENGAGLYAENCVRCHGPQGEGVTGQGPSLRAVGARAADFYLRTGYMPLRHPDEQPSRSRVLFSEPQIRAIVAFVASFGNGPPVPTPHPEGRSIASGNRLFLDHCAGCHQIVAAGGYVTGARVPPLGAATDRQIAQAVRIGPYLMPHFSAKAIDDHQLDSLIAYVNYARHPHDPGGWALGHLGPWPEGLVSWLLGAASLVALCIVIGKRLPS